LGPLHAGRRAIASTNRAIVSRAIVSRGIVSRAIVSRGIVSRAIVSRGIVSRASLAKRSLFQIRTSTSSQLPPSHSRNHHLTDAPTCAKVLTPTLHTRSKPNHVRTNQLTNLPLTSFPLASLPTQLTNSTYQLNLPTQLTNSAYQLNLPGQADVAPAACRADPRRAAREHTA
jgi:hypothetical protein